MLRFVSTLPVRVGPAGRLPRDRRGAAAIEFVFVAPVFLLIALATLKFGIAISQYLALANGASQGATTLAFSRGYTTPYTKTVAAVRTAAGNLRANSVTITVIVNGTACTDDATCKALMVLGATAQITASYPCDLVVMGTDFASGCTLTVRSSQMIQ